MSRFDLSANGSGWFSPRCVQCHIFPVRFQTLVEHRFQILHGGRLVLLQDREQGFVRHYIGSQHKLCQRVRIFGCIIREQ